MHVHGPLQMYVYVHACIISIYTCTYKAGFHVAARSRVCSSLVCMHIGTCMPARRRRYAGSKAAGVLAVENLYGYNRKPSV